MNSDIGRRDSISPLQKTAHRGEEAVSSRVQSRLSWKPGRLVHGDQIFVFKENAVWSQLEGLVARCRVAKELFDVDICLDLHPRRYVSGGNADRSPVQANGVDNNELANFGFRDRPPEH
jgi:hypothetical protein